MKYWSLLMILLVFGCTGGGGEVEPEYSSCSPVASTGLQITAFYPELAEVMTTDEEITFTLETENLGDSKASNIKAEIFNYGGFSVENDKTVDSISDLESYTPDAAFTEQANWVLTPPTDIGTGEPRTYEIKSKLSFDYTSTGEVDVVYIPDTEWRIRRQEGNTLIEDNQQCSSGPVAVSVEPMNPVIAAPGTPKEFTFRVILTNLGEGRVWSSTEGLDKIDRVEVTLQGEITPVKGSCTDFNTDTDGKLISHEDEPVKLSMGASKILSCKLKLGDAPVREATYPITAKAFYRYVEEDSTEITVTPSSHSLDFTEKTTIVAKNEKDTAITGDWVLDNDEKHELVVTLEPYYDGEFTEDFADTTKSLWEATAVNKNMIDAYEFAVVEGYPVVNKDSADKADGTVTVRFKAKPVGDPPKLPDAKLYDTESTITVKLTYGGIRASRDLVDKKIIKEAATPPA